jgi:cytochrome c-type biogenesis protein CcmH
MLRAVAALLVVLSLAAPASALAAGCPKTTVGALEDEVMCQVCGVPLGLAGDALQAQRERAFIRRLAVRCESKDQIKTALVAQFGASVLADPPDSGFNATAWIVPALGVGLGAALLGWLAFAWRRARRRDPAGAIELPVLSGADSERVNAALARWDSE